MRRLTTRGGVARFVLVDSDGRLGTVLVAAAANPDSPSQGIQPQAIPQPDAQAMLNRKVEELQATVAEQRKGMEAMAAQLKEQAAQIQRVSAQLEAGKAAPQVVNNP